MNLDPNDYIAVLEEHVRQLTLANLRLTAALKAHTAPAPEPEPEGPTP